MRIQCPHCPAVYELDDGRVPPAGLSIKCPKCKSGFTVHRPEDGSRMARTLPAKVPLPGTAKAKDGAPAAPRKTQPAMAAQSPQTSSGPVIALPGTSQKPPASVAAAPRATSATVIPLPGTQPAQKPVPVAKRPATQTAIQKQAALVPPPSEETPTEQIDDAIPLPGLDAPLATPPSTRREIPAIELPEMPDFEPAPARRSQTPAPKDGPVALPGARKDETPAPAPPVQRSWTPAPGAQRSRTPAPVAQPSLTPEHGEQVPLPGAQNETSAPMLWSNTPAPAPQVHEAPPVQSASQEGALPLPGLDIDGPEMGAPVRATPAPVRRAATPVHNDLLPDLDLPAPAATPASVAPRRPTPRAAFKLPDEDTALAPKVTSDDDDTALTPKVGVDDTALAPKAGLDPLDFASPQEGHIPDPSGLDFELARPTPVSSSPASSRTEAPPEDDFRLPTPEPERVATPPARMAAANHDSLEIDEPPRTGRTRVPPVIAPRAPPALRPAAKWEREAAEGKAKPKAAFPKFGTVFRNPVLVIGTVLAIAVATVFYFGIRAGSTPAGYFWTGKLLKRGHGGGGAISQAMQKAEEKLGRGTFLSDREALATAAQLLASAPEDDEARAFFVLCASELKLNHGQSGADWDRAKVLVDKIKGSGASRDRARGAYALAGGDPVKARQLLAPLEGRDVESSWLYALALSRTGDLVRASQVLDGAIKAHPLPKLLVLRGTIAKQRNTPDAAQYFEKALAANPDDGAALIELADLKLKAGDAAAAGQFLDKALALAATEPKKLDAGEEARARMLRAKLFLARHDTKEAEVSFERAVQLDPGSAEIHAAYGAFLLQRHDFEKAHKQLESAVSLDAANGTYLGDLAAADLGLNHPYDADKRIDEAIKKDPQNAHLYYLKGQAFEAFAKPLDATKAYQDALAKKPGSVEAIVAQGMVLLRASKKTEAKAKFDTALAAKDRTLSEEVAIGELALALGAVPAQKEAAAQAKEDAAAQAKEAFTQAKEAFTRALQMDPTDPQAHGGLGRAYSALGDLPSAKTELEAALRQVDSDAVLHYEYGSLRRRLGDLPGAIESLQKAVQLNDKDARFRSRLGAAYVDHGDFQKGENELRQARLSDPSNGEAVFYLARALAGEGKLAEALDNMQKAVEVSPENSEYVYNLGLLYERAQQIQNAVESFRKTIAIDSKDVDAYEHLGRNLVIENRFLEAVKAFQAGVTLDPKRSRLLSEAADAQQQAGDLDGAIASYQRSLAQDPSQPGVWSKLAIAYKDKGCAGCKNKAIEALLSAEKVDAKDWVAHRELGYLYKDDGKRQPAIEQFRKYLVLRPDAPDVETIRDEVYYLQEESRRSP
ncbi:MAG: tetratricopeptide repeat protein [Myxococcales bacterium]